MIARVLIDGPSELVFDYAIPTDLPVVEGCRVRVPIRQKTSSGTVLSVIPPPEQSEFAVREIHSLVDPEPLITPTLLKIARWISNYYGSSIESVIRSILPEAVRNEDNSAKTNPLSPPSAPVQRRLQGPPAKSKFLAATNSAKMKTDTPETDAEITRQRDMGWSPPNINNLCKRMERERDNARQVIREIASAVVASNSDDLMVGLSVDQITRFGSKFLVRTPKTCHPLLGAPLGFRFRFLFTLRF